MTLLQDSGTSRSASRLLPHSGTQDQLLRVPASTAFGDNRDRTRFTDSPAGEIQGADRENTRLLMSEPTTSARAPAVGGPDIQMKFKPIPDRTRSRLPQISESCSILIIPECCRSQSAEFFRRAAGSTAFGITRIRQDSPIRPQGRSKVRTVRTHVS